LKLCNSINAHRRGREWRGLERRGKDWKGKERKGFIEAMKNG